VQVLHVCGRGIDEKRIRAAWAAADPVGQGLAVRVVPFVDRMDLAYAAADLVLSRSGASTIAELTAAGVPAVMVPLQHATAGHQAANARVVAGAGGAVIIEDSDLGGRGLAATVAALLADPGRLVTMGRAMRELGHPDAAEDLAKVVLDAAGHRTRDHLVLEGRYRRRGMHDAAR
jgi:UDP-N-acetylglucosamine--N-acetylmuramyl-(pentapeptide) pyrophosphoryl-undecaprenol N-acetylglucosamine transferase